MLFRRHAGRHVSTHEESPSFASLLVKKRLLASVGHRRRRRRHLISFCQPRIPRQWRLCALPTFLLGFTAQDFLFPAPRMAPAVARRRCIRCECTALVQYVNRVRRLFKLFTSFLFSFFFLIFFWICCGKVKGGYMSIWKRF